MSIRSGNMVGVLNRLCLLGCLVVAILCGSGLAQKGAPSAEVYFKRGLAKFENGKCEEAISEFNKAIARKPNHASSFMHRGQCFNQISEIEKAIADLSTAVRIDSRLYFAFELRGGIYSKIGKFKEAIADYTTVLRLVPNYHDALSARAEAYREIGENSLAEIDERKAEKAWELLKNDPRTVSPTLTVIGRRIRSKLMTEAELLDSYIQSFKGGQIIPDSPEKIKNLAREETEKFTKILQVNPNFAGAYFERGNNHAKLGEFSSAIADYSKAIGLDPNDHRSFNNRGIACAQTGNYERAIADFVRALAIEPKDYSRGYNFALVLLNKGLPDQAANLLDGYIRRKPNDFKGYQLRALAYRKLGKTAEAEKDERSAQRLVDGK